MSGPAVSWRKITCEERDAIYHADRPEKLRPISSCTDMSGEFHSEPQMDITWGLHSTDTPILRETRYPSRDGGPDRQPCEHWATAEAYPDSPRKAMRRRQMTQDGFWDGLT